ncbi:MAG: transporter substrate-binding domain-containing protein [Alphaproteobacteria bacterium]
MKSFTIILVAVLVSMLSVKFLMPQNGTATAAKETAYARVMRTGVLRCGYVVWPPEMIKDENTGKLSGISYDMMMAAAEKLGLKVEWAAEANFPTIPADLDQQRYDALCFTIYRRANQAAFMQFTRPLFYSGVAAFVRPDDHRFDVSLGAVNDPNVKISTMNGEQAAIIAKEDFPQASTLSLAQGSSFSDLLLNVAQGKADITFTNIGNTQNFLKTNPGTLRQLTQFKPIRMFAHAFAVAKDETVLANTLNIALEELHHDGTLAKILATHQAQRGVYFNPADDYVYTTE